MKKTFIFAILLVGTFCIGLYAAGGSTERNAQKMLDSVGL